MMATLVLVGGQAEAAVALAAGAVKISRREYIARFTYGRSPMQSLPRRL